MVALVPAPRRAVDAGCGTGKLTVQLAERGVTGVGVEPHPATAAVAERNLAPRPGWRVDRDAGAAQAARLLRPGGRLEIVDHRDETEETPLRRELAAVHPRWFPGPSAHARAPREKVPPRSTATAASTPSGSSASSGPTSGSRRSASRAAAR